MINVFVALFVISAFVLITSSAWLTVMKKGQEKMKEKTTEKTQLAFYFGIFVLINIVSVYAAWFFYNYTMPVTSEEWDDWQNIRIKFDSLMIKQISDII